MKFIDTSIFQLSPIAECICGKSSGTISLNKKRTRQMAILAAEAVTAFLLVVVFAGIDTLISDAWWSLPVVITIIALYGGRAILWLAKGHSFRCSVRHAYYINATK